MKKKPSTLSLVIAVLMGIYLSYKGLRYISIPGFEVVGIVEMGFGLSLIAFSAYSFFKKLKEEEE